MDDQWRFSREITLGNVITVVAMVATMAVGYFDLRSISLDARSLAKSAQSELAYRRERIESIPAISEQVAKNERDISQITTLSNTLGRIEGRMEGLERSITKIERALDAK